MKRIFLLVAALAVARSGLPVAHAGDREWATAGKVLTGVAIGSVIARAFEPPRVYTTAYVAPAPVYVQAPPQVIYQQTVVPPAPVYYPPAPVYVAPAPVYYQPAPVYVAPAPVYYAPAPVYVRPAPIVSFHIGIGAGYAYPCRPRHHHHW